MREAVFAHIKKKYRTSPEYPWSKYDDNAVFRHSDNKKWFALVMSVKKEKLGLPGDGYVDGINLKIDDRMLKDILTQENGIYPAYHMNKEHWITVLLDGTVEENKIYDLIHMGFEATAWKKKRRKTMLKEYLKEIDDKEGKLCSLSDTIWECPETAFGEFKSEAALLEFFKSEGFEIKEKAYGVETAFIAEYGSGSPRIGVLGEFDALSGLSQMAGCVEKKAEIPGACGHGCGHNLLGAGAAAAALAIKKYLEDGHKGTVIFYGCPGEEGGSGKAFMARGGAFKDLDAALTWHPSTFHEVNKDSSLANFQILYKFHGTSAHAAGCPEMGRSALDALELMNIGCNFLREHMIDAARVHYAITDTGGYSPNVVQDQAKAIYLIRAPKVGQAYELMERVHKIAKGAALMTETREEHEFIKSCANVVSNRVLEKVLYKAMKEVGVPAYTQEEYNLAASYTATVPGAGNEAYDKRIADHMIPENVTFLKEKRNSRMYDFIVPYEEIHQVSYGGGSTDVGDVSWMCPTAQINTATWAPGTPGHSWQVVAQGKSLTAHKGMLYAGKSIALAAMMLMEDPELLKKAKAEFDQEFEGQKYIPIPEEVRPRALNQIG